MQQKSVVRDLLLSGEALKELYQVGTISFKVRELTGLHQLGGMVNICEYREEMGSKYNHIVEIEILIVRGKEEN